MKRSNVKAAVVLTIRQAPKFSETGTQHVITWLRNQITFLKKYRKLLAPVYTARYGYRVRKDAHA